MQFQLERKQRLIQDSIRGMVERERFLPDIMVGKRITCTGTTEPDVGSDPRGVNTRVSEDGPDHNRVTGRKTWITNAGICDLINVTGTVGTDERGLSRMVRIIVNAAESPFEGCELTGIHAFRA